jgi:two-component system, NtrC family, response regulator HydG
MDLSKYWKTVVDTLQDGLMVVDAAGTIVAMNPAAEKLTGYPSGELIGRNCGVLNCTGCKVLDQEKGEPFCSLFATYAVREKQCLITNKAQRAVHVIKNASVLKDDNDRIIGAVEMFTDQSELVNKQMEVDSLRKTCNLEEGFHGIIGRSNGIQRVFDLVESVAPTAAPVMILGPSGTGKELVARAIHEVSPRRNQPFIKVNCAALNESLLESELFGHEKGSFTGAERLRIGRFEAAHGGTIFLDEIGDIPLSTQVKLLRVLEEREIERVGDHRPIQVDVRIVTATNKNLEKLIREGSFREDLYFRISVFPLPIPALKDRRDDIPVIIESFLEQHAMKVRKPVTGVHPQAMEKLLAYDWPGNVRELKNAIEYASVLCTGPALQVRDLPPQIVSPPSEDASAREGTREKGEKENLLQILRECNGNQSEAARRLGVSRVTIWKRIKKFHIDLKSDL